MSAADARKESPNLPMILVDIDIGLGSGGNRDIALRKFPENELFTVREAGLPNLARRLRDVAETRVKPDLILLPFRYRFLALPSYWLLMFTALWCHRGAKMRLLMTDGTMKDLLWLSENLLSPLVGPVIAAINLFRLPYYLVVQVYGNLLRSRDDHRDRIVGFGGHRGVSGLIYWYTLANKVKRFGLFGLAHDSYLGVPLSLHCWPLATYLLARLGYKLFLYLSVALTALGMGWLAWTSGHPFMLLLVPLVIFSNLYLYNVYIGTWEILAWGFGVMALAAWWSGYPVLAACGSAAAMLSHPGVALLIIIVLIGGALLGPEPYVTLAVMGGTGALLTAWWYVPYRMAGEKLGRDKIIHSVWQNALVWTPKSVYQMWSYGLFVLTAAFSDTHTGNEILLLVPILVLIVNVMIKWVFSAYTITNFMLFLGASYLVMNPDPLAIVAYLIMAYQGSRMIWDPSNTVLAFDMTPVRLGETGAKIKEAFRDFRSGRIGFEMGTTRSHPGWDLAASLGYILSDEPVDLFNTGYAEIGEYDVYARYCRHFNAQAKPDDFERACRDSAVKYMVAFTDEFKKQLEARGFRMLVDLKDIYLSHTPDGPLSQITVFELPWDTSLVVPPTSATQETPNHLVFLAQERQEYFVSLSAFKGWRAYLDGAPVRIRDARPGMILTPNRRGEVRMVYRLHHYWLSLIDRG